MSSPDPLNPLGHILGELNRTVLRLPQGYTPDQIDDALSEFQRAYRHDKGLPSQGRAAFVEVRGSIT